MLAPPNQVRGRPPGKEAGPIHQDQAAIKPLDAAHGIESAARRWS